MQRDFSRPTDFRRRIHTAIFNDSHKEHVLATIILQTNQYPQLDFVHSGPELHSCALRTCIQKVCCRGQLLWKTCFPQQYIPATSGSALRKVTDREAFTTLLTRSPRQGQQHLPRLTLPNQVTSHMRSLLQKPNAVKDTDVIFLFSGNLAFLKTMTILRLSHYPMSKFIWLFISTVLT